MLHVGFTGTRKGLAPAQASALCRLLADLQPTHAHHGDCIGADSAFHLCVRAECPAVSRTIHPPVDSSLRAFCAGEETLEPKTHFARNRAIVAASDVLAACPCEMTHQDRGGTWYTIDHARKRNLPVYVVWPDGSVLRPDGTTAAPEMEDRP